MKGFYRPTELARIAHISTDTLRHYERLGLISRAKRSGNGYREYSLETLDRVRLIQSALSIGFTLSELGRIFRIRERGGVPCREVRDLAAGKAAELTENIRRMKQLRARIQQLLRNWDERLQTTAAGARSGLLESLTGETSLPQRKVLRRKHK